MCRIAEKKELHAFPYRYANPKDITHRFAPERNTMEFFLYMWAHAALGNNFPCPVYMPFTK